MARTVLRADVAGLLAAIDDSELGTTVLLSDVVSGREWTGTAAGQLLLNTDGWVELTDAEAGDGIALRRAVVANHALEQSAFFLRSLLLGLSPSIEKVALGQCESHLQKHGFSEALLRKLLVAPLKSTSAVNRLASEALADGLVSAASIFNEIGGAQPELGRLSSAWLSLEPSLFSDANLPRTTLWNQFCDLGGVLSFVRAPTASTLRDMWHRVTMNDASASAAARFALIRIGTVLRETLWPSAETLMQLEKKRREQELYSTAEEAHQYEAARPKASVALGRALKQIRQIVLLVSEGNDVRANILLDALVAHQSNVDGREHAVKSLCNVARHCKDLFRSDFESRCLSWAWSLGPTDVVTGTQYAGHLGRIGDYDHALTIVSKVAPYAESESVARLETIKARIYLQQGQYDAGENILRSLLVTAPDLSDQWHAALGDARRYQGDLDGAKAEYQAVLRLAPEYERALRGLALVLKDEGKLGESIDVYERLLRMPDIDERGRAIIGTGYAAVLKRAGRLPEALSAADAVLRSRPFMRGARLIRVATQALLGKRFNAQILSRAYPERTRWAFGEWADLYFSGLLLLQLNRYRDARKTLVERLDKVVVSEEQSAILRLGAAFVLLQSGRDADKADARRLVDTCRTDRVADQFVRSLKDLISAHIAQAERDEMTFNAVVDRIVNSPGVDMAIREAALSLKDRQSQKALRQTLDLLLSVAA